MGVSVTTTLPSAATPTGRAPRPLRLGRWELNVVPPSIHDPRIHLSSVLVTIFVLGIGWLGFRLSIPQIVLTMLTCATIELALVYRQTSVLFWPASAMQTATSTALLLRVIGTENGDLWSFHGWYIFVAVGAFGLLTKYTIRYPGHGHVFNPSNIGLIVAFLVLGSSRVEPLDFWWAPMGVPMALAYIVIFAGGFWICGRLRLLGLSLALWLSLAAGIAVLALMGRSMTTRWSLTPISGWHFWWIILTSPEIFIFLFFMITDPKTVPSGRVARVVFGALLGGICALLMAPWGTEFGVKVGLLSGLAVMCAARPLLERRLPAKGSPDDDISLFFGRVITGRRRVAGLATAGLLAAAIAVAGLPARGLDDPPPVAAAAVGSVADIDPASLPTVTIDPDVGGVSAALSTSAGAQELATTLAWNLQVEAEALATGDASLLRAVDHGKRLLDMQAAVVAAGDSGERVVPEYQFDSLHLVVVFPGGLQNGPNAGLQATGTVTDVVYRAGIAHEGRPARPFSTTFALREFSDGRWLTTDTLPLD
jgi:hypothetical protein